MEFRDSKKLRYRYSTNSKFEIDIYIPSKKVVLSIKENNTLEELEIQYP